MTMNPKEPWEVLKACEFGGPGDIAGGVTYQEVVEPEDGFGKPAIHFAAESGQLDKIKDGVTAKQLAEARHADTGKTALHCAAESKSQPHSLRQIAGGVTALDLIAARDNLGWTALHSAVYSQTLEHIDGGVTIQQLIEARDNSGQSAILINPFWVDHVKEDLKFDLLAAERNTRGQTVIHILAQHGRLNAISGGVTAQQLDALRDGEGTTALQDALIACAISQINGGLESGLLTVDELNTTLIDIVESEYVGHHCYETIRELIRVGANKIIVLEKIRAEASTIETSGEMHDWQKDKLRFLIKFAQDSEFYVSDVISSKILAQLI